MKQIEQDELYQNLSGFLKGKGIELTDGTYAAGIQKGCTLLADAINLSQQGIERAKTEIDKKVDQMRHVIHEKTAPKPPPCAGAPENPAPAPKAEAAAPKTEVKADTAIPKSAAPKKKSVRKKAKAAKKHS